MASVEEVLQSSQSFVRALKSNLDPPHENGLTKIEIASSGWSSHSFYVPRKAGLIIDWILTRFHKEREKCPENSLLDPAHWSLLADILAHPGDTQIEPLIIRASVLTLIASLITSYPSIPVSSRSSLTEPLLRALGIIWPIALPRAGLDPLAECIWQSLAVTDQVVGDSAGDGLENILILLLTGFRTSFDNASVAGRKKAYTAISNRFIAWLCALDSVASLHHLHSQLYLVGIDILYSPEALRITLESNPTSKTNNDIFSTLFGSSTARDQMAQRPLLRLMPELYQDYVLAIRKHRSSVFLGTPSGHQTRERIRRVALRFGDECLAFLKGVTEMEMEESVWKATLHVLRVTEEQALFASTESDNAMVLMRRVAEDALRRLDRAWDDSQSSLVAYALDVLSCLQRIEPELGVQFLPQILERLATSSSILSRPALNLLCQLTSYHSKTRTLNTLVSHMLSALISSFDFLPASDPKTIYNVCARSPLLSLAFANELINAIHTFGTPGQADDVVTSVLDALAGSLHAGEISKEPARKRRKVSVEDEEQLPLAFERTRGAVDPVRFALVSRVGTTALAAVLHHSAAKDAAERKRRCLTSIGILVLDIINEAFEPEGESDHPTSKGKGKRRRPEQVDKSLWMRQLLCSSLLRLWYGLFAHKDISQNSLETDGGYGLSAALDRLGNEFTSLMRQDVLPELHLEIGRAFYARRASSGPEEMQHGAQEWPAFDTILDYIEKNLFFNDAPADLKSPRSPLYLTKRDSALALWSLTLERYMLTVDAHASQNQLQRLVNLIIRFRSVVLSAEDGQSTFPESVLARVFSSAGFWELGNIRSSILLIIEKETSVFGSLETLEWLSAITKGDFESLISLCKSSNASLVDIEAGAEIFHLLHYFPPGYFPRAFRISLALKALNADVLVQAFYPQKEPTLQGQVEWRAIFRSFVVIIAKQTQMKPVADMASSPEWMAYLSLSKYGPALPTQAFNHATLDLLSLIQGSTARAAIRADGALLANVSRHFSQYNPYSHGNINDEPLVHRSLLRFASTLTGEFHTSNFQESILPPLRQLTGDLEETLLPAIRTVAVQNNFPEFLASGGLIQAWHVLLLLRRWLMLGPAIEAFGQIFLKKIARILSSESCKASLVSSEFRAIIFSLIVAEGEVPLKSDCHQVSGIVAAYVLFTSTSPVETACDTPMARASKSFSLAQYGSALEIVASDLENGPDSERRLRALIHLSTVLLRDAPERTSRPSYEHASRCLRIFINRVAFFNCSSVLATQILDFVQSQCTERAGSFKASDVASILFILSKQLVGCSEHDGCTSSSIFQSITHIVNTLIRLRRDLLSPHLPHLSMVLRQLISITRGARPFLGIKQYHIVASTFPKWINPTEPLGEAEARSLSRLLTSIVTKSLVRSHGHDKQKAESLARPFARHAPYVLLAYLQMMNDPLSYLSVTMRRELEPGLFALCAMMGDHGRDTLMVQSLDIGGKTLLKSLWREYDRQRYIGQG